MQANFMYRSNNSDYSTIYFEPYENRFGIFCYNTVDEHKLRSLKWLEEYLLNNLERRFCIDLYFHPQTTENKLDDLLFNILKTIILNAPEKEELYFNWAIKYYFIPDGSSWGAGVNYRSIQTNLPLMAIELNEDTLRKLPIWITKSIDPFLKQNKN